MNTCKAILLTIVLTTGGACSATAPEAYFNSDPQPAEYKGYSAMNEILDTRLVAPNVTFELSSYLGPSQDQLKKFLGYWGGFGVENEFRNGQPNAFNLLLWRLILEGFGRDIATHCPRARPHQPTIRNFKIHPELIPTIDTLCRWPSDSARSERVLRAYWTALVAYDASPAEFEAWRDHFLDNAYREKSNTEVITAMTVSALMSPYVLLER